MTKMKRQFIGIQYNATGLFGYSFRENGREIFKTGCLVVPNPDVELIGFGKKLWHRNLDREITLFPGVRRNITDETGNVVGYYDYLDFNQFNIIADNTELTVYVFENGWKIYCGTELVSSIYRLKVSEREQFIENGIDMETRFSVTVSEEISDSMYPYIMAIPMLGF